ncbi:hypothetical protein ABZS71_09315 [Streptomyces sp. NPDC005393]|uniref:hypothetical protein n=1 Tax=Streptomyces sp. NPDC005393 TaxID=3157041 RepID=UPI0033AA1478
MAEDHRCSWLDDSAAERLLRGEPVEGRFADPDGRSDRPGAEAERLAAVLGAVAGASRPTAEAAPGAAPLPGEEAAVAAFRAARAERAAAGRTAPEEQPGLLVWLRGDRPRLRRPLRAGMVAALAGCALGGFAVAAVAGVLPTPFGESGGTPGPAVSVSGVGPSGGQSAHPEISEDGSSPTPDPGGSGDNDASDAASTGAQGGAAISGGQDDGTHHGNGKRGKGKGRSSTGSSGQGGGQWALDVCRQYLASESGTGPDISKKALHKLKNAAGGRAAIHGYCVEVLGSEGTGTPRSGNDNGSGNGTDNGGGSGDSSGSGDSGGSDDGGSGGDSGNDDGGAHPDQGPQPPPPPPPSSADPSSDTPTPTDSLTPADSATTTETGAG